MDDTSDCCCICLEEFKYGDEFSSTLCDSARICRQFTCTESPLGESKSLLLQTKCRHIFHQKCLQRWLRDRDECPICRSGLRYLLDCNQKRMRRRKEVAELLMQLLSLRNITDLLLILFLSFNMTVSCYVRDVTLFFWCISATVFCCTRRVWLFASSFFVMSSLSISLVFCSNASYSECQSTLSYQMLWTIALLCFGVSSTIVMM